MRYKYKLNVDRTHFEAYEKHKDIKLYAKSVADCLRRESYYIPEENFKEDLKQTAAKLETVLSTEEYKAQTNSLHDWAENNGFMIKGLYLIS